MRHQLAIKLFLGNLEDLKIDCFVKPKLIWQTDPANTKQIISAFCDSLRLADSLGLNKIAFPCFEDRSTTIFAIEIIKNFGSVSLKEAIFIAANKLELENYLKLLNQTGECHAKAS